MRLRVDQGELVGIAVVIRVCLCGLDRCRLGSSWCWAWEANDKLGREKRGVGSG
jgi:hypothetical protein